MDYDLDGVSTDDEIAMPSGSLTFSGQQFSNFGFTWTNGFGQGTYTLVNAQSISGLGSNLSGSIDGLPATLSVQGSGNNQDLVLNVTPEPSTFTLLGVGATGLMAYVWRRRRVKAIVRGLLAAALLASAVSAQASTINVFNMPSGETSLQFVTVGDPGNLPGPATGGTLGSVPYVYKMGTYDVTVGQYCQFLNAVATTGDPYGLYNSGMATDMPTLGIAETGSPGNGGYSVIGTYGQAANCPIFDVTWGDAARFCNWLQNGQPAAPEGNGTTETGAYTLDGDTTTLMTETRNLGASYFLPSENEWYKAAYYVGGGTNSGYWTYPTKSNVAPDASLAWRLRTGMMPTTSISTAAVLPTPRICSRRWATLRRRPALTAHSTWAATFGNGTRRLPPIATGRIGVGGGGSALGLIPNQLASTAYAAGGPTGRILFCWFPCCKCP